ncbi:aldo/keto reductase [Thermosipho melanesiensis]|uniref:NADP-dependent oxidoreductase domain-containing protein n=1 Tax=Thermosipho melanesiensis TaxID=46541 RepID=A0ABN4UYZ4_9BACT|nr:aldo/keto reductase [Thermosipho melanesiensis]APT74802.1 hypothetical protein BW47_01110 [Thermosipho melanesiensis]
MGIVLPSKKHTHVKTKYYDISKKHIIVSVEKTLKILNTDFLDILLIHRLVLLMDPNKNFEAFEYLKEKGMVINFGISNFKPNHVTLFKEKIN